MKQEGFEYYAISRAGAALCCALEPPRSQGGIAALHNKKGLRVE